MSWVTLYHLVGRLKAGIGDFCYRQLFMVSLLGRNYRCIGNQGEVDPGIGNQVCLELSQIYIERTVKSKRGSNGRDNLANEPVEVSVGWAFNVKVPAADVVDGLIVYHEGTIGVFKGGVSGKDGVVWLNNSSSNLKNKITLYQQGILLEITKMVYNLIKHSQTIPFGSCAESKDAQPSIAKKYKTERMPYN